MTSFDRRGQQIRRVRFQSNGFRLACVGVDAGEGHNETVAVTHTSLISFR
jgi:hypothetical protein